MVDHTKSHTIKYSPIPYFILDNNSVMRERLLVPLLLLYNNDRSGRNRYEARFGGMTLLPSRETDAWRVNTAEKWLVYENIPGTVRMAPQSSLLIADIIYIYINGHRTGCFKSWYG